MVDNGGTNSQLFFCIYEYFFLVTRGYLPRSILIPLLSNDHLSPPTPMRRDISVPLRAPQPLPRANSKSNYDEPQNTPEPSLINSSHYFEEENERIYLNQLSVESHQYASIDPDDSTPCESNEQVSNNKIFSSSKFFFVFVI